MTQVQYTVEPQGRPLAVMVSIATLEQALEVLLNTTGLPSTDARSFDNRILSIRALRAAIANAEPKKISLTNTATGSLPQRIESIFEAMDKEVAAGRLVRTGPMEWRKL